MSDKNKFKLTTLNETDKTALVKAGVPVIKPAFNVPEDAYEAMDHLPEGVVVEEVRANAVSFIEDPDMNQVSFLKFVTGYERTGTATVQAMLENVKARNAGEAGERVVNLIDKTRKFDSKMPEINKKFLEKFEKGTATAREVMLSAKWLWNRILKVLRRYEDMLELTEEERVFHMDQFDLSLEATIRDNQISENEDDREKTLIVLVATLEHMAVRIAEKLEDVNLEEDDRERLNNVGILVTARIHSLRPMIAKANASSRRFSLQSNSNALTGLKQYDFATEGIDSWQTDIAGQIGSLNNMAQNMAYLEGVRFTEDQAIATADSFNDQMNSMAKVLKTQLQSIEAMRYITESLMKGYGTLGEAINEVADMSIESAKAIQKDLDDLQDAEEELASQTAKAMKKATNL